MHPHSPDENPAPQPGDSGRPVDPRRVRADDLRYLLALSRTGRLVTAADALGVDHTTVSRRIAALEKSIGLRLIERGQEGWTLTDIGRAVSADARAIEEAVDRVADTVAGRDSPSLHGTVRVSAPDGFGTAFATPALVRVRRQHPRLQLELITATRQLALHPSGFDLALVIGVPSSSRLVTEHLTDYTLGLYASEDYLAQYGRPETVAELREHPLIFYIESMLQVGDLGIERHLPGLTPAFSSTNVFAQLEATRQGAGIGVLPAFLTQRTRLRRLLSDEIDIRLPITLAVRREAVTHAAVRALWAALRQEVAERADELLPE
ncbi:MULTISPECIES: LysR family transcriptional regulator [unclassified Streptomyces]|uniref:LysR family transcriptional regulator n=1 Tax=unclassified Streptomyces TaxID=2593676 RepID=UPI002E81E0D9|nr:LysR family transcriptional regulator [Streptomyces sp. NBC_00589]WTI41456.1 LysR family transcriptional regulator [Streptomyces sp. NBC_00775]WUB24860.1 LysR family transcriptional regulator [Streptomyces sp. NBC_00589]